MQTPVLPPSSFANQAKPTNFLTNLLGGGGYSYLLEDEHRALGTAPH